MCITSEDEIRLPLGRPMYLLTVQWQLWLQKIGYISKLKSIWWSTTRGIIPYKSENVANISFYFLSSIVLKPSESYGSHCVFILVWFWITVGVESLTTKEVMVFYTLFYNVFFIYTLLTYSQGLLTSIYLNLFLSLFIKSIFSCKNAIINKGSFLSLNAKT